MFFAAVTVGVGPIAFSGSFSTTAAPSGGYVTSGTITVSVPGGNTGQLRANYGTIIGTVGGIEYNKNSAGFVAWTDGSNVTFANNDTVIIRAGSSGGGGAISAGESLAFTLTDMTKNATTSTYTMAAV